MSSSVSHLTLTQTVMSTLFLTQTITIPNPTATGMTEVFKQFAMAQIKLFIFAGHDTTSAAAVFTFYLVFQHPEVLAKIRREHDEILGTNPAQAGAVLKETPHLINQLAYTLATVKEAMRLYPPVAVLRQGTPSRVLDGVLDRHAATPTRTTRST